MQIAVHPKHGVIWTDGKAIYLAPIQVEGHQVQNAASVKLGEFENVTSVHWSSTTVGDTCHLCVVHQQNVTVWRVSGALPKLSFKQVRKINVRPVPQGCLWNPCNDVLCLLSRQQCSFYFRHDMNKGSYAFPALESGSIACGCWSPDGTKLVLCVGAALLIYRWSDVNAAVDEFAATAWRIPGLEGKLTSIAPVQKDSVVVTAEIPLETLCKQQDTFKVPDAHGGGQSNRDGIIRPSKSASVTESLMNLQQNNQAVTDSRSTLTMIHLRDGSCDPAKLSTVPLKGVLTPDILMYEKSSQCVVVGSNTQSQLHIYALLEKHLAYCGNIQLDKGQRPKGLCSMPTYFDVRGAALLILVGQREVEETGIMSPSLESEFRLSLKYIILKAGFNHHSRHNGRSDSVKGKLSSHAKSSSLTHSEIIKAPLVKNLSDPSVRKEDDNSKQDQQTSHAGSPEDQIKLPISSTEESLLESEKLQTKPPVDDIINKGKMIEDLSSESSQPESLEVDTVPFSSQVPSFNNSRLAATYDLDSIDSSRPNDQTDSLHYSLTKGIQGKGTLKDTDEKTDEISRSSTSSQVQPQYATEKYLKSDQTSADIDSNNLCSPERQESSFSGNNSNNNCYSRKNSSDSLYQMHDNDQGGRFLENVSTSPQTEGESCTTKLESEIKHQIASISSQTEIDSIKYFSSVHPERKHQMASISSQTERDSQDHFSSSQPDIKLQRISISSQTEGDSTGHSSSSQSVTKHQNTYTFSQTEEELLFSRPQSSMKPQSTSSSSQTERCLSHHFSSLQSETTPQARLKSLQTEVGSSDQFDSLQPDITPQTTSASLHTVIDSPKHFSSLQPGLLSSTIEERTELSDLSHTLRAHDLDHTKDDALSDLGFGSSQHSVDSSWDALEKQAKSQKDSIEALHRRLESLSITVEKTTCVFPTKYQEMSKPEIVEIYCEKPEGTETKRFLLDNGRLQLEPIKLAFGLATVELWLDGIPCVLGANIDGYIPLKFSPSTKLHITGRPVDR